MQALYEVLAEAMRQYQMARVAQLPDIIPGNDYIISGFELINGTLFCPIRQYITHTLNTCVYTHRFFGR